MKRYLAMHGTLFVAKEKSRVWQRWQSGVLNGLDEDTVNKCRMNGVYSFPLSVGYMRFLMCISPFPQGLYIFLVYAVYNSEVRRHSVHCQSCCLSPLQQNIRMYLCTVCEAASLLEKLVGVNAASHLGEECHKEDQRKEEGLIFHGEWVKST